MNRKIFFTLFFSIFAAITGVGIVVPLLPVYADGLGAGGFGVGMIFGAFSLSRTFFLPYFGRRSDIYGRKPYICVGLFCYALVSLAFLASSGVWSLIIIRFFQGIASAMIMPVVQAYVGELTPPGKEGFVMGLFQISMYLSLSAGPLLGGLVNDYWGLNRAFILMGLLCIAAFLLSWLLLPPTREEPRAVRAGVPVSYRVLVAHRSILGLVVFRFAYTVAIGVIWSFLPVLATEQFHLSSFSIGVLIMLGVFVAGLLQTPMGFVADRSNKSFLVAAGGVLISGAVLGIYSSSGFWSLVVANAAFGVGGGISIPALMALCVIEGKRTKSMGPVMALLTVAHSLGMLVGSLAAGLAKDFIDLRFAYVVGAAFMALGVVVFLCCARKREGVA